MNVFSIILPQGHWNVLDLQHNKGVYAKSFIILFSDRMNDRTT